MLRVSIRAAAALGLLAGLAAAQEGIRRGTVKAVNTDRKLITLTTGGQDEQFHLTAQTRVFGAEDKPFEKRFAGLKPGTAVMFKTARRGGKEYVVGLKTAPAGRAAAPPKVDTSELKPLPELGTGKYHGHEGGLYPGGTNTPPPAHAAAGRALAEQVRPLGPDGKPNPDGKIVLLSIGMSNTTQEFAAFQKLAAADARKNPRVTIVDGAQGGMTAGRIVNPDDRGGGTKFWSTVDQRLKASGATREQVRAVWLKEADAGPTRGFPKYAEKLRDELRQVVQVLHARFPNLKLVYLSCRTYGGYARTRLNPEPYAYESGFAVKWLIAEQLKGDPALNFDPKSGPARAPWLGWGPYLWANGRAKSANGLAYEPEDFGPDGTHPSASGRRKVAGQLLTFFQTDPTAKPWFLAPGKDAP